MSNLTVGLGLNQTEAWIGNMIGNELLGTGAFIGLLFIGLLAFMVIKGRGGAILLMVVMTVGVSLMAQYGYLPAIVEPAVWMILAVIWGIGILSLFKG